jgi:hypothetical protein
MDGSWLNADRSAYRLRHVTQHVGKHHKWRGVQERQQAVDEQHGTEGNHHAWNRIADLAEAGDQARDTIGWLTEQGDRQ